MSSIPFNKVKIEHLEKLEQFVPIVERVHGKEHPEFFEVRRIFDRLSAKITALDKPALAEDFIELREVTSDYSVPTDVCESYEAVYNMLEEMDQSYQSEIN